MKKTVSQSWPVNCAACCVIGCPAISGSVHTLCQAVSSSMETFALRSAKIIRVASIWNDSFGRLKSDQNWILNGPLSWKNEKRYTSRNKKRVLKNVYRTNFIFGNSGNDSLQIIAFVGKMAQCTFNFCDWCR